jgi:phosphohistidine phosphatase SixA
MKTVELRRHAAREKGADALSAEGRAQAERVGRGLPAYDAVFVSPARRAAETVEAFARGAGRPFPSPTVVPGLASEAEDRWRAAARAAGSSRVDALRAVDPGLVEAEGGRLAGVLAGLVERVPEGGRALAVGHSPLIEAGVLGLTGRVVEPLGECEGVALTLEGGQWRVEELRLPVAGGGG